MGERVVRRLLADAREERDRLADVIAHVSDQHRRNHKRLNAAHCGLCLRLGAVADEPSVIAAQDRRQADQTTEIDHKTNRYTRRTHA
jgi:hypothetical protein